MSKCGFNNKENFRNDYQGLVEAATRNGKPSREPAWSESIAVGSRTFFEGIKAKMGVKATGRKISKKKESFILNEPQSSYKADFVPQMDRLSLENMYFRGNI